MASKRITTGVKGMDEILHGGLSEQGSYLLVGSAGTGKTVFSLQWLLEGQRCGEKTLYITLAEPAEKIEQNVAGFGWTNMFFSAFGCGPCVKPHGCKVIMPGLMLSREKKSPA